MMSKQEIAREMVIYGMASELLDVMRGASFNEKIKFGDEYKSLDKYSKRLFVLALRYVDLVAQAGVGAMSGAATINGKIRYASPHLFEAWVDIGAPGVEFFALEKFIPLLERAKQDLRR